MFFQAKNKKFQIEDTTMDYISFGQGKKTLVILPGLSDGLRTVKGFALPLAWTYKAYTKDYTVFVCSRKNQLPPNYSTRDMANDQAKFMKALGLTNADVMGVSQGGMIAQYLAIDHPKLVQKLVLVVTCSQPNETLQEVVKNWMTMAKADDYRALMMDTAKKTYSDKYQKKYQFLLPLLGLIGKPNNFQRFLIQAQSCLEHNAYLELPKVQCKTLVLAGGKDQIVGPKAFLELVAQIPKSEQFVYQNFGHGTYEEAKDFSQKVLQFLNRDE